MSRPTSIYLGWCEPFDAEGSQVLMIAFPALLFCTSRSGRVIESMYGEVKSPNSRELFDVWRYGDESVSWGGGLRIKFDGVGLTHYLIIGDNVDQYQFAPGEYELSIYAKYSQSSIKKKPIYLAKLMIELSTEHAKEITDKGGKQFDWKPNESKYIPHKRPCKRLTLKVKGRA